MIIQTDINISIEHLQDLENELKKHQFKVARVKTQVAHYLIVSGKQEFDIRTIGNRPGVIDVHVVSDEFQLVSRKWKIKPSSIEVKNEMSIGGNNQCTLMAGPCSIENEAQIVSVLQHLKEQGVQYMRGGVFKPRSSPYAFRGLGIDGLKLWHELAKSFNICIVTEVMQVSQIDEMLPYTDIFQVGARNTQNYNLLDALGQVDKPVLLKRGISGTIDELLFSAEYIFSGGNEKLILCERGIRTYERASRNTLDLNAIPILKAKTHLPVMVDPSHGIGMREHVRHMALAGVMAGADGIIYEVHPMPEEAYSDGQQTLNFEESKKLVFDIKATYQLAKKLEMEPA